MSVDDRPVSLTAGTAIADDPSPNGGPDDEELVGLIDESTDLPDGALSVLRRGLAASPPLYQGLVVTVLMGLSIAVGKLTIPVILQQAIDRPPRADGSFDVGYVVLMAVAGTAVIVASGAISWAAQRRLVDRAEQAIADLRVAAFDRIHRLSIADQSETQRGVLVARVTSDAEALARFAQWGLYSWTINPIIIIGTFVVMAWYSWPLALVALCAYTPVLPWYRWLQRRQLAAYDELRTRVGQMLTRFSEAVMGAAVVRAYGVEQRTRGRLHRAIEFRYRARMRANRYMAGVFVTGDVLGVIALVVVLVIGITQRSWLGIDGGELVALLFLTTLVNAPIGDLGETLDQTQTAIAGWRKILDLLDHPEDVVEPTDGRSLPAGALRVQADRVRFAYRDGVPVLSEVSVDIPAGINVAIVGETGSGKSTFVKLLCRLADPTSGIISIGGVPLRSVDPAARLRAVRMVPQDGFLFDTTIRDNVRYGAPDADEAAVDAVFTTLGLDWWVAGLSHGLDYEVGERGENLSVGERQLVALARAALADPGLLILDEATSSVDPETDRALTSALRALAEGRTMVSVAHRLSTAETADLVLVFDQGRLVERGPHAQLVTRGGSYSRLHQAWEGNTRREAMAE
jgi:ABC-type multidrug transport system fused ATPase/permease subunit